MQQELVRMVVERTGLSDDKARAAVESVVGYLKDKLPSPVAGQLEGVVSGGGAAGGGLGSLVSGLGSRE